MARIYHVKVRTGATAATADHGLVQLWNPSSTARIKVLQIKIVAFTAPGAGAALYYRRTSARGSSPGSTVTPTIDNDNNKLLAPPSGALIDLGPFGTQPTHLPAVVSTVGKLGGWIYGAVIGSGIFDPIPDGIIIPAGNGLVLANETGIAFPASDVTFSWEE